MMSCPLPIVPVIQPLPTSLSTNQTDFPIHIGIKVIFFFRKHNFIQIAIHLCLTQMKLINSPPFHLSD